MIDFITQNIAEFTLRLLFLFILQTAVFFLFLQGFVSLADKRNLRYVIFFKESVYLFKKRSRYHRSEVAAGLLSLFFHFLLVSPACFACRGIFFSFHKSSEIFVSYQYILYAFRLYLSRSYGEEVKNAPLFICSNSYYSGDF